MTQTLRDHVVHILHTKEGAQIGSWCVTYGSPKDRKAIIKVLLRTTTLNRVETKLIDAPS